MQLSEHFLQSILSLANDAGEQLKALYSTACDVYTKADNTPVTEADLLISEFLTEKLTALTPDIPILSEENCQIPLEQRQHWETYWLIDPLDGTQQFIDRTGQFAIMIALIHKNRPILGVIHAPILQTTYYAMQKFGAYKKQGNTTAVLSQRQINLSRPLKIAVGSSCNQEKVRSVLKENLAVEFVIYGSSGLKSTMLAEGVADCYVRLGNTGEWDTAAAEILLEEVGGVIFDRNFSPLTYNKRETLINPHFVMAANKQVPWQTIFKFNSF